MRRREPSGDPRAFVRSFRAIGLTARELQSVLISTIGFYLVVTGIPALVASLIPQSHYGSGIVGQGVVRPAVQLIIGVLILTTRRLTLVACPVEVAQALLSEGAERILGAAVPPGWPLPELTGILPLYLQELLHDPSALGWGIWISMDRGANAIVGDVGFKGRPAPDGTVEIGYGTAPPFRGQGYATEAVHALVGWAFTQPEVGRVVAECAPENAASIRVLTKAGFRCTSVQAGSLHWARSRRI